MLKDIFLAVFCEIFLEFTVVENLLKLLDALNRLEIMVVCYNAISLIIIVSISLCAFISKFHDEGDLPKT